MVTATESTIYDDIADGKGVLTGAAARLCGVSPNCVFRWITRGLPGRDGERVRLRAVLRGKSFVTTREEIRRFFAALPTNAATPIPAATRSPSQRKKDDTAAAERLRCHGV